MSPSHLLGGEEVLTRRRCKGECCPWRGYSQRQARPRRPLPPGCGRWTTTRFSSPLPSGLFRCTDLSGVLVERHLQQKATAVTSQCRGCNPSTKIVSLADSSDQSTQCLLLSRHWTRMPDATIHRETVGCSWTVAWFSSLLSRLCYKILSTCSSDSNASSLESLAV